MPRLTLSAPAKVNLSLRILGLREDGYHELLTLMQPLSLADELTVELVESGLAMRCSVSSLNENNLVLRAAEAYFAALGRPGGARFFLNKKIPVAAGLGGGSSDAAAALIGLNALHDGALPPQRLVELAAGLGADVPFFLSDSTALCSGIGENVEPLPSFPSLDFVLINPRFSVSTAWVFGQFDLTWTKAINFNKIGSLSCTGHTLCDILVNDLEKVTMQEYPQLGEVKRALADSGAQGVLMSGSGPTVFGVFPDAGLAARVAKELADKQQWWVCACRGI